MATATKTTRTRKAKSAEDLKADLAKARAALAALEQRAYAGVRTTLLINNARPYPST